MVPPTSSTKPVTSGTLDTKLPADESTRAQVTLGLQIPTLRRSQALLAPPSTKDPAQLLASFRGSKRKECAEDSPFPSGRCTTSASESKDGGTRSRALSDVGEDVDTDALAEHLFAVIRAAESALSALGFEEDVDSVAGAMDDAELDATDGDRASPLE